MERYIARCLDSLLIPCMDDVEILVINDGSKDRTSDIAHTYADRYPGSIRVIDKPNGHYGSCINRGLAEATGQYIKVLDADDSFDTANFARFVDFLKHTDADMVFSDYCTVDENGDVTAEKLFPHVAHPETLTFADALPLLLHANMAMHAVAYRTALLRSINYRQTEGVAYTDQEWIFLPVLAAGTAAYFPHIVYRYLVGRAGQSVDAAVITKAMTLQMEHFAKRLDDFDKVSATLGQAQRQYAFARMRYSMVNTFKCILFGKSTAHYSDTLLEIDRKLRRVFPALHASLGRETLKSWLPFRYIGYWRRRYPRGKPLTIINAIKSMTNLGY